MDNLMDHLGELATFIGLVKAIITGVAAGTVALVGFYMRQKAATNSQIRTERWVALIGETVWYLVEAHNHLHPEAKLDTKRFARLLFDIGVRRTPPDEG
jgi:uncharacterized membrane-anchored protein